MKLFVSPEDTFEVHVYIAEDDHDRVFAAPTIAGVEKSAALVKAEIKPPVKHSFVVREPSYKDDVQIVDSSLTVVDGQVSFKSTTLRMNRLVLLLKSWTLKNEKGEPVPCNSETIGSLKGAVAAAISEEVENALGLA